PPCCARMNRNRCWAELLPVCPYLGVLTKEMKISADITWSGRVTWSKSQAGCWRREQPMTRCGCCAISKSRRRRRAIGRKTCGWTSGRTGMECRWMRPLSTDCWNDSVERWTYAVGNDVCKQLGVDGYYVRIAPPEVECAPSPLLGFVPIKNRPPGMNQEPASHLISPDSLALVRFGLRAPDDPRILNTIRVIDALLRVRLPQGPCWYRYNGDGYGEHADGSPFDGTGIGRPWPLLAGERGHYE